MKVKTQITDHLPLMDSIYEEKSAIWSLQFHDQLKFVMQIEYVFFVQSKTLEFVPVASAITTTEIT